MAMPLLEMEGTGAEVAKRLADFAHQRVYVVIFPAEQSADGAKETRPIAEVLAEIAASVPPQAVENLPSDFTDQLDHYIYGAPKR